MDTMDARVTNPIADNLDVTLDLLIKTVKSEYGIYQNLPFPEFTALQADRNCDLRWDAMAPHITQARNYLDLGCNMGYFVFRAHRARVAAMGIDNSWANVALALTLVKKYMIENVAFMRGEINLQTINALPEFDCVTFLSVFHHLVFRYGVEESQAIAAAVARKTRRFLFFETGQYNERTPYSWGQLSFMGDDPYGWADAFLHDIGFTRVTLIAEVDTHLSGVRRGLFMAIK